MQVHFFRCMVLNLSWIFRIIDIVFPQSCTQNCVYRQTDRQIARQGESNISPLNFVCGGIKISFSFRCECENNHKRVYILPPYLFWDSWKLGLRLWGFPTMWGKYVNRLGSWRELSEEISLILLSCKAWLVWNKSAIDLSNEVLN